MYGPVLIIHSWLRWITLLLAIGATIHAMRQDTDLSLRPPGARWDAWFMAAVDLQLLFGLVLYFGLSPYTLEALNDLGGMAADPLLLFWTVWHLVAMVSAVVLVRVGRIMALSAQTPQARRSRRLAAFAVATVIMIVAIPWPGLSYGRPLFRV